MEILKIEKKKFLPKIIILTHGDADGLTSAMIIETAIRKLYNNKFEWIILSSLAPTAQETEKMIDWVLNGFTLSEKDKIYIVDRSMPTIKYLDENKNKLERGILISIDHHLTNHPDSWRKTQHSKYINFIWDDEECGATLTLEWFKEKEKFNKKFKDTYINLKDFAEVVKLWDIFSWTNLNPNIPSENEKIIAAKTTNAAEKIYGGKYFYKKLIENVENLSNLKPLFSEALEAYQYKYESTIRTALYHSQEYKYGKYLINIFYDMDKDYQPIFSHEFLEENKADILIFINSYGTASLKSRKNLDISEWVEELGELSGFTGGGHKNASGFRFTESKTIEDFVKEKLINILKKEAKNKRVEFQILKEII